VRTTLTLDDDVAAALKRLRGSSKGGLKALVNQALRLGLQQMRESPKPGEPFRTEAVQLGRLRIGGLDNVADALSIAEGEPFR
jgi:hypothetical protein